MAAEDILLIGVFAGFVFLGLIIWNIVLSIGRNGLLSQIVNTLQLIKKDLSHVNLKKSPQTIERELPIPPVPIKEDPPVPPKPKAPVYTEEEVRNIREKRELLDRLKELEDRLEGR